MAPLAARRVAEMVGLGERIVAIELAVGAQATDLRGVRRGRGTGAAVAAVRQVVPFLETGDSVPDVEPLVARVREGAFAGSFDSAAASAADRAAGSTQ